MTKKAGTIICVLMITSKPHRPVREFPLYECNNNSSFLTPLIQKNLKNLHLLSLSYFLSIQGRFMAYNNSKHINSHTP